MNDNRYILVIADDSPEMEIALEYACARSKKTSRKIIIATFIEPLDVLTTQGVTEIMKNEAREEAEKLLQKAANLVKNKTGEIPALTSRSELIESIKKFEEKFKDNEIPRPKHWNGYIVKPHLIEFWQEMSFRLHDRVEYNLLKDTWHIKKLYP